MSMRLVASAFFSTLLLLASAPAGAASISGLGVVNHSSADSFDDGIYASESVSAVAIQSEQALGFSTRYTAVVGADKQNNNSVPSLAEATLTGSYDITFMVVAAVGETWTLQIDTLWLASMTAVDDVGVFTTPASFVNPTGVTGSIAGIGLDTGTLDFADPGQLITNTTTQVEINETGSATTLLGSGAANIILSFSLDAVVQSACGCSPPFGRAGREAALRMGIAGSLSDFSAGDYPGVGNRDINGDGHFVSVTLLPEPGTALLALGGLAGLARAGRRRSL
jgi:hypothetical protein